MQIQPLTLDEAKAAVERVVLELPELNDFGFGVYDERSYSGKPQERAARFAQDRALMFHERSLKQFIIACDWFRQQPRCKNTQSRNSSSYELKHLVADVLGYITNGMFICAAQASGVKVKRIFTDYGQGTPNAEFNLPRRLAVYTPHPQVLSFLLENQ